MYIFQGSESTSSLTHGDSTPLYTVNMSQAYKLNLFVSIVETLSNEKGKFYIFFFIPRRWNREGDIVCHGVVRPSIHPSVRISFPE
jgi:hypothetical protein